MLSLHYSTSSEGNATHYLASYVDMRTKDVRLTNLSPY